MSDVPYNVFKIKKGHKKFALTSLCCLNQRPAAQIVQMIFIQIFTDLLFGWLVHWNLWSLTLVIATQALELRTWLECQYGANVY